MNKAILIKVSGEKKLVVSEKSEGFSLKELQGFIGGIIQIVPMPKGRELICHDEGKLIGLLENAEATKIWKEAYPIEEYPHNNDELIVGDILITGRKIEELIN